MKVLVCGSRYKNADIDTVLRVMEAVRDRIRALPQDTYVITGGAVGVDTWAHREAGYRGLARRRMPAKWRTNGHYNPRAGFERNRAMLDLEPDLVIAFWDGKSRGTIDTLDEARERSIPVEVIAA